MTRMYYIDTSVHDNKSGVVDITEHKKFRELIGYKVVMGCTSRMIGSRKYCIYYDDCYFMSPPAEIAYGAVRKLNVAEDIVSFEGDIPGRILIASSSMDEEGDNLSLTDEDIQNIEEHIDGKIRAVIVG